MQSYPFIGLLIQILTSSFDIIILNWMLAKSDEVSDGSDSGCLEGYQSDGLYKPTVV